MTTAILEKHVKFVTNALGEQTDIIISLENNEVKEYFQDLFDAISAMERDDDSEKTPFETIKKRVLETQKSLKV